MECVIHDHFEGIHGHDKHNWENTHDAVYPQRWDLTQAQPDPEGKDQSPNLKMAPGSEL